MNFAIAVKAFIVKDGKLLLIKRRPNDVHKPGTWDIPGGRLDAGENPMTGVQREALEEVGLSVEPIIPIAINHFTRDDGQQITMIIFLCRPTGQDIKLSEEHTESQWLNLNSPKNQFPKWLHNIIDNYQTYIKQ